MSGETIKPEGSCPLDKKCDGCHWSMEFETSLPDGQRVKMKRCSQVWTPLLLVELLTMIRTIAVKGHADFALGKK